MYKNILWTEEKMAKPLIYEDITACLHSKRINLEKRSTSSHGPLNSTHQEFPTREECLKALLNTAYKHQLLVFKQVKLLSLFFQINYIKNIFIVLVLDYGLLYFYQFSKWLHFSTVYAVFPSFTSLTFFLKALFFILEFIASQSLTRQKAEKTAKKLNFKHVELLKKG